MMPEKSKSAHSVGQSLLFLMPMLFFAVLGAVLTRFRGHYSDWGMVLVLIVFPFFVFSVLDRKQVARDHFHYIGVDTICRVFVFIYLIASISLLYSQRMMYSVEGSFSTWMRVFLAGNLCASVLLFLLLFITKWWTKFFNSCAAVLSIVGIVALLAAKILVPCASPSPAIDVWTSTSSAVDYLVSGHNPYPQYYEDIYSGHYGYRVALNYWPGILLWIAPFKLIFGDVRYAYVADELITSGALYFIGIRFGFPLLLSLLFPLLWLSLPISLFVLEQSWIDSHLISLISLLVVLFLSVGMRRAEDNNRDGALVWLGGGIVGLLCAVKQYIVFVPLFTVLWIWKLRSFRCALWVSLVAMGVFLLFLTPFAILHWESFWNQTVLVYFSVPPRADAFSIVALLHNEYDYQLPGWFSVLIYCLSFLFLVWWLITNANRAWSTARNLALWIGVITIMYSTVFFLGKQAFCSYYYLLAYFILLFQLCRTGALLSNEDGHR